MSDDIDLATASDDEVDDWLSEPPDEDLEAIDGENDEDVEDAEPLTAEAIAEITDEVEREEALEKLQAQHELRVSKAEGDLKAAVERAEALRGQDGDLRPSETRELFESTGKIKELQAVVDTLQFRAPFVGMGAEQLGTLEEERYENKQAARAALREIEEQGKFDMVEGDRRVLSRRREAAFQTYLESLGSFEAVGRELGYRKADTARGFAERLATERRAAAKGEPQPAFPVGDDGSATLTSPAPSKGAEPMVKRDVPLSQSEPSG
jgi:hypothetical protein